METPIFSWTLKDFLKYLIIDILICFVLSFILYFFISNSVNASGVIANISYTLSPFLLLFWHKFVLRAEFGSLGFIRPKLKYSYIYSIIFSLIFFLVVSIFYLKNFEQIIRYEYSKVFLKYSLIFYITTFKGVFIAFIVPFAEEILFRSVVFQLLLKKYNLIIAMILSSLIFALLHITGSGPDLYISIATRFIFGVFAASLFYYSKSIFPSLCSHIIGNILVTSSKAIASLV